MDIKYRTLKPEDSLQYRHVRLESLKLHPECFGAKYLEQINIQTLYFERLIQDGYESNIMLGAFHGNKLIGLCGVTEVSSDVAEIIQMYVESGYRGKSIGVQLLSLAKQYASTELNVTTLKLAVYPENQSAIRSYEKSGFKVQALAADLTDGELCMVFEIEVLSVSF